MSPVGGLSHQGKIDPEQSDEKPKTQRDAKRRTVQVEYVAPQSQTVRGEVSPPVSSPAVTGPLPTTIGGQSRSRARTGSQGPVEAPRKVSTAIPTTKPLPQEPTIVQAARQEDAYLAPLGSNRPQQRSTGNQQNMPPPARPGREVPRSVSDSTSAFGQVTTSVAARPITGGSLASTSGGRLPSRGNSYSQPLAPTVAATNAQGKVTQPKNGKQYNISAPIPQQEPYRMDPSIGRPNTQQMSDHDGHSSTAAQADPSRGHKRSNTLGNVFSRSGSVFGGRSQTQSPQQQTKQQADRRYPPTSMKNPIGSDSPRQSNDSRRSTSFGFGRKNSDLGRQEKPRRFSLLPASFSFKSITGSAKDQPTGTSRPPTSEQRQSSAPSQAPRPRTQSKVQPFAFGRGASRSNSYDTEDSVQMGFDGLRDRNRETAAQQARRTNIPARNPPQSAPAEQSQSGKPQFSHQQDAFDPRRPSAPGQSYLLSESGPQTPSENSVAAQRRLQYPPGFNDYEEEPLPSMQQGRTARGPAVLTKNNRRFADAYEQEKEPGYGAGGQHAGSSGAARKVMDFFRRRGKARAGDDR